jgi:hypothetical protein
LPSASFSSSALISLVLLKRESTSTLSGQSAKRSREVAVVLLGQQRGRHEHRDLLAGGGGDEGRAHRDLGLAEADVAADHAIHRLRLAEVADHRFDRGRAGRAFSSNGNVGRERFVQRAIDGQGEPGAGLALGLDLEQFGGNVTDLLGGPCAWPCPLLAAERVQRRGFRRGAGSSG